MCLLAYLCLALVALMAGDSYLIEEAVELADDSGDLLGQVAGVHDCGTASGGRGSSMAHAPKIEVGNVQARNVGSRRAKRHDGRPVARMEGKKARGRWKWCAPQLHVGDRRRRCLETMFVCCARARRREMLRWRRERYGRSCGLAVSTVVVVGVLGFILVPGLPAIAMATCCLSENWEHTGFSNRSRRRPVPHAPFEWNIEIYLSKYNKNCHLHIGRDREEWVP